MPTKASDDILARVLDARFDVVKNHVEAYLVVENYSGIFSARLPEREVAALLPRCVLLGTVRVISETELLCMLPVLKNFTIGRIVRIWNLKNCLYCTFHSWKAIMVVPSQEPVPTHSSEYPQQLQHL